MKYRALDENGDYTLGTGRDFISNSPETVAQAVKTRLGLWTGEWFLDVKEGTPWMDGILGKTNKTSNPNALIRKRILGTQGVKSLAAYNSQIDKDTRRISVQATINTIYGQTSVAI